MHDDRAYAGDVILMLGLLATFGLPGAAVAVILTFCRHSPVIVGAVLTVAERTTGEPVMLPNRVMALLPGAAPRPVLRERPALTDSQPPPAVRQSRGAVRTPEQFAQDKLFVALNEEPHRLIIGHTRGGKTTAMHAMAQAWSAQGHPVYVLDPDAAHGSWPGCEVAGYAEDYDGIDRLLDTVRGLFDERSQQYAAGQREFAPIHLVADEVHETIRNVPGARDFLFETVGRRGAKRGMFLTLGTQGNNVDELDLESAGVLNNFITAELEKDEKGRRMATVYRGNASRKKRAQQFAVPPLRPSKDYVRPITEARQLPLPEPAPVTHTTTNLRPAAPVEAYDLLSDLISEQDRLRQQLLATMSPERAARLQSLTVERAGGDVHVNVVQAQQAPPARRERKTLTPAQLQDRRKARAEKVRTIRQLVSEGKSANEINRLVPGDRKEILRIVREVRGAAGM